MAKDIRRVYLPPLRHRILLNFEAQAENIPADAVLEDILKEVKEGEGTKLARFSHLPFPPHPKPSFTGHLTS